jgi:hypothetical protein
MAETETSSPLPQNTDCRIRWFGVFDSPHWERPYRIHELPESIKIARIFIGIVVAAFLAFLVNDYRFFGLSTMMGWMLALRAAIILGSFLMLRLIHHGMPPSKFDFIVIAWTMGTKIVMLAMVATRPPNFIGYTIVIVMSVLLTYWIVPLPLVWRALTAWFMTAGVLIMGFWINPWPDGATAVTVTLALLLTNVIGGEMCREQQIWRRRQFLALRQQQELSASLELALGEIKTLRGILPICMHCKRISDDAGRWEPIEVYVREHSHAEFSHGLCPECARSHYPEIDWEDSRRQRELRAKANLPDA